MLFEIRKEPFRNYMWTAFRESLLILRLLNLSVDLISYYSMFHNIFFFFRISDSFPKNVVGSNRSVLDRNSYPVNLSYFSLVQLYSHFSINFLDTFEFFVKLRFCVLLQFFIKGKEIVYGFKSLSDFKIASNYLPIHL